MEGYDIVTFSQNWETGKWFNSLTVSGAVNEFREAFRDKLTTITDEMIEVGLRSIFPTSIREIEKAEINFSNAKNYITELLEAQANHARVLKEEIKVVKTVLQLVEAERMKEETEMTAKRVSDAKRMLGSGKTVNLADLKNLLNIS